MVLMWRGILEFNVHWGRIVENCGGFEYIQSIEGGLPQGP